MAQKAVETKKKVVKDLKDKIEQSNIIVLSDYRGVSVKQITELRKALHKNGAGYKIVKNSLIKRAAEAAGFQGLDEHLAGPTALLIGNEDPVEPLKNLVEFVKDNEKGEIKVGIFEKAIVDKKAISEIAKLPSREVLLAKVVGGFQAPICGLVNTLAGTIRKLVYALNAVKEKKVSR
ncbi:MAG: 50S ribosomal protein L10 [Candidatus Margulisiibacteriota bacterium]|nr:50S ribosomal protein L10 [Candidatus Margulisiibacteriota bacterium]